MLTSEQIGFGSTPQHKEVLKRKASASHGNFGAGDRTFKALIYNEGDEDVTVTLDGSAVDSGYGLDWTTRATVTVPARSKDVLEGAIRGTEDWYRLAVQSPSGDSKGRIEIFDLSDKYKR